MLIDKEKLFRLADATYRTSAGLAVAMSNHLAVDQFWLVEKREDGEGGYYYVEIFTVKTEPVAEITADDEIMEVRFERDVEYERSTHLISKLSDVSKIFGDIVVASELLDYLNNDVDATVLGYALHVISSRRKARQFISDYCGALNIAPHDLKLSQCEVLSLGRMVA